MQLRIVMLLFVTLALGCSKTVPIEERAPIRVPAGLTANEVEVAILYELAEQNIPEQFTPGERIADSALRALFRGRYQRVSGPLQGWYPESAEPNVIYAGYEKRRFYMRVAIRYSDTEIRTQLIESENLKQSATRVHRAAYQWIGQLEIRIRRVLGQMAALRTLKGREPK